MLERSRIWGATLRGLAMALAGTAGVLAGCATPEPERPVATVVAPAPKAVVEAPVVDPRAQEEEARALLAQAETDIQRARTRRALWAKAWESLVGARAALAGSDYDATIRQARRASEFALLGLEQLAYPAVRSTP